MSDIKTCGIAEMERALQKIGACQVVDVREPTELKEAALDGALSIPLSTFDQASGILDKKKPVYLVCRTGARARDAACRLKAMDFKEVLVVEGGLKEWIEAGKPVVRGTPGVWNMERQVRFAAGFIVLTGLALAMVHPLFLWIPAFTALGLVYSAVTDTCGMAVLLGRMPWNRAQRSGQKGRA